MSITYVMGVSGSGKSTVASAMARALGAQMLEGDDFHPPQNVAHMAAGQPLTDAMRKPWLAALRAAAEKAAGKGDVIVSCSGLKAAYRAQLASPDVVMVMLTGAPATLQARMTAREGHFMPTSLLTSQLDTLELPGPSEPAVARIDIDAPPDTVLQRALNARETLLHAAAQARK